MHYEEPRPILTVDITLFTVLGGELRVALQRRDKPPCEGELALIGGYVHVDEDASTLATAARVLKDKAGLKGIFLEQLMTFSGPKRDPRGWSASVAYYALVPADKLSEAVPRGLVLRARRQYRRAAFRPRRDHQHSPQAVAQQRRLFLSASLSLAAGVHAPATARHLLRK